MALLQLSWGAGRASLGLQAEITALPRAHAFQVMLGPSLTLPRPRAPSTESGSGLARGWARVPRSSWETGRVIAAELGERGQELSSGVEGSVGHALGARSHGFHLPALREAIGNAVLWQGSP